VRRRNVLKPRDEVRGDEIVLARIVVVERPLADSGFGGNGVAPDGANPLPIEEPICGRQDARGRSRRGVRGFAGGHGSYTDRCTLFLTKNTGRMIICKPICLLPAAIMTSSFDRRAMLLLLVLSGV